MIMKSNNQDTDTTRNIDIVDEFGRSVIDPATMDLKQQVIYLTKREERYLKHRLFIYSTYLSNIYDHILTNSYESNNMNNVINGKFN